MKISLGLLPAVLVAATTTLQATIMIPLSIGELTQRAELVVHGTVKNKECLKDPAGRIYTRIEFEVAEVWKGQLATNTLTMVRAGGVIGDEQSILEGEAEYEIGAELVSFVRLNHRGEGVSIGLAQGQFKVWTTTSSNTKFVNNLFHGTPKPASTTNAEPQRLMAAPPATSLTLEALHAAVVGE